MIRREFIKHTATSTVPLVLPWGSSYLNSNSEDPLTIGLVADAHQDIMHDAEQRLEKFVKETIRRNTDFNIQLGDFCFPIKENRSFFNIWSEYQGPKYHVLGNHDMDTSSKQETIDYWGMESSYYSFDQKGFHFVVLDANFLNLDGKYVDYEKANFYIDSAHRTWIHPEQIEWLAEDLARTSLPTVVFVHQGMAHDIWGIKNRTQVQLTFEKANEEAGFTKVVACFNGHNHVDGFRKINGIYYIEVNSLSYQWLGEKYQCTTRYPKEVYDMKPIMVNVAPFEDALFAMVTLSNDKIVIEGMKSRWIGPSPEELGLTPGFYSVPYTPVISDREFHI